MQKASFSREKNPADYFCLPAWFVDGFEACAEQRNGFDLLPQRSGKEVEPGMTCAELALLPTVLESLQGRSPRPPQPGVFSLCSSELEKFAGLHTRLKKRSFARLLKTIGSIHIFAHTSGSPRRRIQLFDDEVLIPRAGSFEIELQPSEYGLELINGYVDAYRDSYRSMAPEMVSLNIGSAARSPLLLRRSLWLELSGVEHLLYLRVEKAVQWAGKSINLDEVFGDGFAELYKNASAFFSKRSPLSIKRGVEIFVRLAKKLVQHGVLVPSSFDGFDALGEGDSHVQLLWKYHDGLSLKAESKQHAGFSARAIFSSSRHREGLAKALVAHRRSQFTEGAAKLSALIDGLYEGCSFGSDPEIDLVKYCLLRGNKVFSLVGLYLEWVLRKQGCYKEPLEPGVIGFDLYEVLPSFDEEISVHQEKFARFLLIVEHQERLRHHLSCQDSLSVVEFAAKKNEESDKDELTQSSGGSRGQRHPKALSSKLDQSRRDGSGLKFESGAKARIESAAMSVDAKNQRSEGGQFPSSQSVQSSEKTRKTRLADMKKIRKADYLSLTEEYLNSIDANARKVILSIKDRMEPRVFDQHIELRLLNYLKSKETKNMQGQQDEARFRH